MKPMTKFALVFILVIVLIESIFYISSSVATGAKEEVVQKISAIK